MPMHMSMRMCAQVLTVIIGNVCEWETDVCVCVRMWHSVLCECDRLTSSMHVLRRKARKEKAKVQDPASKALLPPPNG